jgi:hypothetical protein
MPQQAVLPPIGAEVPATLQSLSALPAIGQEVPQAALMPAHEPEDLSEGSWNQNIIGGVRAGLFRSIFGVGDLIRRSFGMRRIIDEPTSQALMERPKGFAGGLGFVAERAGEFAVPLSKVARVVAPFSTPVRMAANAAAGGAVSAVQSGGEPVETFFGATGGAILPPVSAGMQMIGGAMKRGAAGAAAGGLGGALAGVVRTAAPVEPQAMIVQAIKPRSTRVKFDQSVLRAMPEIKAAETAIGRPIGGVDDLLAATKAAKKGLQQQLNQLRGPLRAMHAGIDASPVADAMLQAIPKRIQLLKPGDAARLVAESEGYRKSFSLDQLETYLQETNAALDGFYNLYPRGQHSALMADPGIASLEAQAKALRDVIYKRLDAPGQGAAARELNRRYGALLDVEGEAIRRSNVAKRQQPESLSEQIGAVRAAADIARGTYKAIFGGAPLEGMADIMAGRAGRAAAKAIKESQTTDALIRRAFANWKTGPAAVAMPSHRPPVGLLERGPLVTPPPADTSFVRGVPAMRSHSEQLALPPSRGARPEMHLPGEVAADRSGGRTIPAAPADYRVDPFISVKAGGFRVAQFSSDPDAAAAAVAAPPVRAMLERMKVDLAELRPERGRLVRTRDLESQVYAHGSPGSPVGDDIRVISEQHVSNVAIERAVEDLLAGKRPTNRLHTAALDAAMGYLEKRPGYRGPSIPAGFGRTDDAEFEAFSRMVDDFADDVP